MTQQQQPYQRTALADYVTIFTGVSTLAGGIYSLLIGQPDVADAAQPSTYWNVYLLHGVAVVVTVVSLYFFLNQSLKFAKRVVDSGSSALPRWLVMGLFYFAGMALFVVFQIVFQSNMFETMQWVYLLVSLILWLVVTIPLMVVALIPKPKPRRHRRHATSESTDITGASTQQQHSDKTVNTD